MEPKPRRIMLLLFLLVSCEGLLVAPPRGTKAGDRAASRDDDDLEGETRAATVAGRRAEESSVERRKRIMTLVWLSSLDREEPMSRGRNGRVSQSVSQLVVSLRSRRHVAASGQSSFQSRSENCGKRAGRLAGAIASHRRY